MPIEFHNNLVTHVQLKVNVRWTTVSIEREIVIGTIPMHFAGVPPSVPAPSGSPISTSAPSAPPLEPPPYSERE